MTRPARLFPSTRMRLQRKFSLLALLAPLLLLPAVPANADSIWLTAIDGNFNDSSKWSAGVPALTDKAILDKAGSYTVTLPTNTLSQIATLEASAGDVTFDLGSGSSVDTVRLRIDNQYDSPESNIGGLGNAEVTVKGGRIESGRLNIGYASGTSGTLNIVGNGASPTTEYGDWLVNSNSSCCGVRIGYYGSGELNITNGGRFQSRQTVSVAERAGSTGSINVDGAGSSLQISSGNGLQLGSFTEISNASLQITNGGKAGPIAGGSTPVLWTKSANGGSANVLIDGAGSSAQWSTVTNSGTNTYTITNGGLMTTTNMNVAGNVFGPSHLTLAGDGNMQVTNDLNVTGSTNSNSLTVSGGMNLTVARITRVYNTAGARLDITGAGTSMTSRSAQLGQLGNSGSGLLRIADNAVANIRDIQVISAGMIEIDGGTLTAASIDAFNAAAGAINIKSGSLTAGGLSVGYKALSINTSSSGGVATFNGAISSLATFVVGETTTGVANIGESTTYDSRTGALQIGAIAGSNGIVNVSRNWDIEGNASIGGTSSSAGGSGQLNVLANGRALASGTLKIWGAGSILVAHGGQLSADTLDLTEPGSLGIFGILEANTVNGSLINDTGTFAAGVLNKNTYLTLHEYHAATLTGDYTQGNDGILSFDMGGFNIGSNQDFLSISGVANLDGELHIDFWENLMPAVGQSFDILSADSIIGTFDRLTSNRFGLEASYIQDISGLDIVRVTVVQGVPVPAAAWLFGSALGLLGWRGRRSAISAGHPNRR